MAAVVAHYQATVALRHMRGTPRDMQNDPKYKSVMGKAPGLRVSAGPSGTAATVALSIADEADIVRVHDVLDTSKVATVTGAVVTGRSLRMRSPTGHRGGQEAPCSRP